MDNTISNFKNFLLELFTKMGTGDFTVNVECAGNKMFKADVIGYDEEYMTIKVRFHSNDLTKPGTRQVPRVGFGGYSMEEEYDYEQIQVPVKDEHVWWGSIKLYDMRENIGKKVTKKPINGDSNLTTKPFKSGFKINTIKDVINHPILNVPAYTFFEDESYVECRRCKIIDNPINKKVILFIGLPGSGKSHYIRQNIMGKSYYIVDADMIKETHPDYDVADPESVHQWSVKEAENKMNELSDLGLDICMDSGGVNNTYSLRIINMLKSKGYHIEIIYMDTPLDICITRNRNRVRKVPEDVIITKSEKIESCVEKQKPLVDIFTHIKFGELEKTPIFT